MVTILNISSSIKNVKFDFGNGYIVAEILNRYYPQDVRLNSFDTGQSKKCRKDNWQYLKKLFNKYGIPVMENDINELINTRMNSGETAVRIISTLYSFFLKKNIKPLKPSSTSKKKSTSSTSIEDNIQIENNKEALKLMLIDNQNLEDNQIKKEDTSANIYLLEYIFKLFGYKGSKKIYNKSHLDINNLYTSFLDIIDKSSNDKIQKSIETLKNNQDKLIDIIQNSNTDDIIFLIQLFAHILANKDIQKKIFKVSVVIIPIIFSSIRKSIGSNGIKLFYNSNSFDEIINGMTIEKIPFFSGCIESIANGSPIEENQTQEIYDKIKQSFHKKNINYELAFITTMSVIDPKHACFHINSILSILNSSNTSDMIDYSSILHYLSILLPCTSTNFVIPLLRKFNQIKKFIHHRLEQLNSIKDMDVESNEHSSNGLIRSWIRFLTVIIQVLAEVNYSNSKSTSIQNKKKDKNHEKKKLINQGSNSNSNSPNQNGYSRCSSSFSHSSNETSRIPINKNNLNGNKAFTQKKQSNNFSNNSIELPNGEIIEIPESLEDINIDEIYSPIIFCQEIVNVALNEIVELLPKLNDNNLKLALFFLAPNLTHYTNLCHEFVKNSLRIPLEELEEIFPIDTNPNKIITFNINWQVPYFNSIEKMTCFEITDEWRFCYCMGFINMIKGNDNKYYYEYLEYFIRHSHHPMPVILENILVAIANDENQLKCGLSILEHLTFTDEHLLKLLTTVLYIMEYGSRNTCLILRKWLSYKTTNEEKIHMNKIKKWINNEVQKMLYC